MWVTFRIHQIILAVSGIYLGTKMSKKVDETTFRRIALILDGGACRAGVPSTILDCSVLPPEIVRQGVIGAEELYAVISVGRRSTGGLLNTYQGETTDFV